MTYENPFGIEQRNGEKLMQDAVEVVQSREIFFDKVSLSNTLLACGDDRTKNLLIKLMGGILNPIYQNIVMQELTDPGSVTDSFEEEAAKQTPLILKSGAPLGAVHSDTAAEGSDAINLDQPEGKVGCGYAELRQAISAGIFKNEEQVIAWAQILRPELFESDEDLLTAKQITATHGRLAERQSLFTSGREVVLTAADQGAQTVVVDGQHTAQEATVNLVADTTLDGSLAAEAGLEVYDHDSWALEEIQDKLRSEYPYDKKQQQIAEIIDVVGTLMALGVERIGVRRK